MPNASPVTADSEIRLIKEHFTGRQDFLEAISRLKNGEPVQYITGKAYFYDEVYKVSPDCLIPRPDTERLVDRAVKFAGERSLSMLDLCTGSGCIAISAAAHCPMLSVDAAELSESALAFAAENARLNGVANRVAFMHADICDDGFASSIPDNGYDIITSNPPYIASNIISTLDKSVGYEPVAALDGGADGLDFYRVILKNFKSKLSVGGIMLLEIGYDQAESLMDLAARHLYSCSIYRDYGGNDRVAELRAL